VFVGIGSKPVDELCLIDHCTYFRLWRTKAALQALILTEGGS
jgi:hypothetical protein